MTRKIKALAACVGFIAAGLLIWIAVIALLCVADAAGIRL